MIVHTISRSDAAVLLRLKLGDIRSWSDFLADNIRHKQDIEGYTVLPCAKKEGDRGLRPVYSVKAIQDFIDKVLAALPEAGRHPIKVTALPIDTGRGWRNNKFDRHGAPLH